VCVCVFMYVLIHACMCVYVCVQVCVSVCVRVRPYSLAKFGRWSFSKFQISEFYGAFTTAN
jgi:hypothetical protein